MKDRLRNRVIKYARLYNENLNNKKTLFVYADKDGKHQAIEILCRAYNYLHLTGVKTKLSPTVFFERAVGGSLSIKDYEIKNAHGTEKKLCALESIVNIHKYASMIGNYNNSRIYLEADKIIGTEKYCLALRHDATRNCYVPTGIYVPVSSLQDNISALVEGKPTRILAIFQKCNSEKHYTNISSISNKTDISQLRPPPPVIKQIEVAINTYVENHKK